MHFTGYVHFLVVKCMHGLILNIRLGFGVSLHLRPEFSFNIIEYCSILLDNKVNDVLKTVFNTYLIHKVSSLKFAYFQGRLSRNNSFK